MPTTQQILNTAGQALTLAERIVNAFSPDPKRRARRLRLRAIRRRSSAATARLERRRVNLLAGAAADEAMADVLDPSG